MAIPVVLRCSHSRRERADAWSRRAAGIDVQLRVAGGAGPGGPSAAGDPADDRRALARLSPQFGTLYVQFGRPSIPPEQLLRALLLQALYTIRSERQLMEQLDYNLLFRWFVGPGHGRCGVVADDVHEESRSAARRRHRRGVLRGRARCTPQTERLLSDEHFTVDGTLLEAWASHKSFQPARSGSARRRAAAIRPSISMAQRRANDTHQSTTDPDARLYQESAGARSAARLSGACADGASVRA